ncbi:hypothetical protein [uncultured Maricaulis sp.]|tara:strand:- start:85489 stop:85638 length:150 start_codon:yes stop_codon:yes gene_type:complete
MNVIAKKTLAAKKAGRATAVPPKVADMDMASMYKDVAKRFPKTMKRLAE